MLIRVNIMVNKEKDYFINYKILKEIHISYIILRN